MSFMPQVLYPQGKSPWYPLDRRLGEPTAGLDNVEKKKFLSLSGLDLRPLSHQPIASCYTDYAILAPICISFTYFERQSLAPIQNYTEFEVLPSDYGEYYFFGVVPHSLPRVQPQCCVV
jgi:hypothetical protein